MAFDNIISRQDVQTAEGPPGGLIPEDASREIIQSVTEQSAALQRFRRVPMARAQQRMPVLAAFAAAYFVGGDTGLKETTELAWADKFLNAEEIATIVPVPVAVLRDSSYDIWAEVRPRVAEAVARKLDAAVFFGTDKPTSWPDDIVAAAVAAGNAHNLGTATAAEGGNAEDINQTMGLVEGDGFAVNGFFSDRTFRAVLRGARATDGQRLLDINQGADSIYNLPVDYGVPGLWPDQSAAGSARMIAADWTQFIVGVRQDLEAQVFEEGVITDAEGAVVLNLMQQDAVALRVTARYAFQVANPKTHSEPTDADRYPAAVLRNEPL